MRSRTVIFSLIFHAAIAATLLGAAGKKALRKATSVAFTEEKKKAKAAPPKPPPAPPKQVARPPERKVAAVSKALPEPVARAAAPAPVATALTMTNDEGPGGIALPTHAAAAKPAAAAAGTTVASAVTEARKQRLREAASAAGEDAPCEEEPSKPVLVSQQPDIELTASARAEGIEGKLTLSLIIGEDGTVTGVKVVTSISPEMDAAAEAAVRQWRFKPALACGKPVVGKFNLRKTFELGD
jgi:protein TonB